jgi:20S proteasome subunit beta 7
MALSIIPKSKLDYEGKGPINHTTTPIVTGSTVLALKFKGGILLATDNLCSYGSMAMFRGVKRIESVTDQVAISSSGEFSDFQEILRLLTEKTKETFL